MTTRHKEAPGGEGVLEQYFLMHLRIKERGKHVHPNVAGIKQNQEEQTWDMYSAKQRHTCYDG